MKNPIVLMSVYAPKGDEEDEGGNHYNRKNFLSSDLSDVKNIATVVITKPASPTDYEDWLNEVAPQIGKSNQNLTYGYDTQDSLIFVDLLRIEDDDDHEKKVKWLKKYQDMIDYNLTGKHTKAAHFIAHPEEVPNFYPAPNVNTMPRKNTYREITVANLIARIDESLANQVPPTATRFEDKCYDFYVEIDHANNNLVVNTHKDFDPDRLLFSIPFLQSITENLDPSDDLAVGEATFKGKQFQYIWVVGTTGFYNYSNEPR